jgi:hypothetical protein
MKSNQEILDTIGKLIVSRVFDGNIEYVSQDLNLLKNSEYQNLFNEMSDSGKKDLENFIYELSKDTLFEFLNIFEESENYKFLYEENGKQVNLVEISEMLKAEPIIENGWIDRFSEFSKK